jgi:FtsP/CotA-like multicopper oxidase with cupredoxin domain
MNSMTSIMTGKYTQAIQNKIIKNLGRYVVSLALLSLLAFLATACGAETSSATTNPIANSGVGSPIDPSAPANPGPAQVTLGDGPAGVAGSRFTDPDVVVNLTADVFQWEVYDGEFIEVWGYNQQYPGPEIRVKEGDKVRINLTNNLPEATTIHWHGLEVPNDQDGVPGITQPDVPPGGSWTYEFVAPKAGTAMYHTHSNTIKQLTKGLFGAFIVEPREGLPQYDREYTLLLYENSGFYTINGRSFPKTLEDSLLKIKTGERILIRMINAGQSHHPMHLHGHQFTVVQLDGNPLTNPLVVNTQDIAPGQTVDVEVFGTNPGTWVFHCHIIFHVANKGQYPGGMLIALDYEDDVSFFEEQAAASN